MVELDSFKVQAILPPLSDAEEELQDKETVGVVDLPLVMVKVLLLVSVIVLLVLEVILTL